MKVLYHAVAILSWKIVILLSKFTEPFHDEWYGMVSLCAMDIHVACVVRAVHVVCAWIWMMVKVITDDVHMVCLGVGVVEVVVEIFLGEDRGY